MPDAITVGMIARGAGNGTRLRQTPKTETKTSPGAPLAQTVIISPECDCYGFSPSWKGSGRLNKTLGKRGEVVGERLEISATTRMPNGRFDTRDHLPPPTPTEQRENLR